MQKLFLSLILLASPLLGAEHWNGVNKDGDGSNSNATPLGCSPALHWQKVYSDFPLMKADNVIFWGRRSNNLCIRNGEIMVLTPQYDGTVLYPPGDDHGMARPRIERLSLADGSVVDSYFAPISGCTVSTNKVGLQDTDLRTGQVFSYWGSDNIVHISTAGDWGYSRAFSADTGERILEATYQRGSNQSAYFQMHDSAPGLFVSGGSDSHRSWTENSRQGMVADYSLYLYFGPITAVTANTVTLGEATAPNVEAYKGHQIAVGRDTRIITDYNPATKIVTLDRPLTLLVPVDTKVRITSMAPSWYSYSAARQKHYSSGLMNGPISYNFTCFTFPSGDEGYGYTIGVFDLSARKINPITGKSNIATKQIASKSNPTRSYLGFGLCHCGGAPRALCVNQAGDVCMWTFTTKGTPGKPGRPMPKDALNPQVPDPSIPFSLTVLDGKTLAEKANISSGWAKGPGPKYMDEWWYNYRVLAPQIATIGKYVCVFQPRQNDASITQSRLFCFDVETKTLVWSKVIDSTTDCKVASRHSTEQAVQMTIIGTEAVIAEPLAIDGLKLRVTRYSLATGAAGEPLTIDCEGEGTDIDPATVALRELAAVDGNLVFLVDFKGKDVITLGTLGTKNATVVRGKTNQWLGVVGEPK
jgi:hypothetical protein